MNRRKVLIGSLIGCGGLFIVGLLLVVAVTIGANIGMQKAKQQGTGDKGETTNTPSKQESDSVEILDVVLRVSGDRGTSYECTFNTNSLEEGEVVSYTSREWGTLGSAPVDYTAQIVGESSSRPPSPFNGNCLMTGPYSGGKTKDNPKVLSGRLKAEVIINGVVKDEDETRPDPAGKTSQESMAVQVRYNPLCEDPKAKSKLKGC